MEQGVTVRHRFQAARQAFCIINQDSSHTFERESAEAATYLRLDPAIPFSCTHRLAKLG